MILPIGDHPNPRGAAPVTWALIAINLAIYVFVNLPLDFQPADPRDPAFPEYLELMTEATRGQISATELARETSAYDLFVFSHGFRPAQPSLASLLVCMFLHASFLHVAGNMLFLWIYGDNVESRLGPMRYLFWYLATGMAATSFHALLSAGSPFPLLGASGAISGVLGFYFVWFPKNHVRVLWFLPPFLMQVFEIPARVVLSVYLLLDNLLPLLFAGSGGGVAHGAHIGGFLAGLAVAWVTDRRATDARPELVDGPTPRPAAVVLPPSARAASVESAIAEGRFEEAASAYFALPAAATRGLLGTPEAVSLARWLRANGHPDAALVVLRRAVRDASAGGPGLAEAYALLGSILLEDRGEPTAAYQYLLTALELDPPPATAAEVRRGLAAIDALQKRQVGRLHGPRRW
jgi:membrane associated rhomboid family serine protease